MSQLDKKFDDVDLDAIVRKNPKIDMKQVKEARAILEEIRPLGKRGYNLVIPFTKQVHVDDSHQPW